MRHSFASQSLLAVLVALVPSAVCQAASQGPNHGIRVAPDTSQNLIKNSLLRLPFAAVVLALAIGALTGRTQASPAGYLWMQHFSADAASSGQVTLSGLFVNDCTGGLPTGAFLRIFFDRAVMLDVHIDAGPGGTQSFSSTVTVPLVPKPVTNVTAYRFTIVVPGNASATGTQIGPDMKTSPCLVTPAPGTPKE